MNSKNLLIFGIVTIGVFLISSEVIWAQQASVKLPKIPVPKPARLFTPPTIGFGIPATPNPFGTPQARDPLAV